MDKPILELKDIYLVAKGRLILNNVNFSVSKGALVAIIGESGSGKSTLLRELLQAGSNHTQGAF